MNGNGIQSKPKKEVLPAILLVLCLALFTVKAVTSMVQESSTWDETCYFGLGKYLLQNRRWDVPASILHPPLSYYIHSIPLLFFPTDKEPWKGDPRRIKDREYLGSSDVLRGQAALSDPLNQGDRLLDLSRLMMVLTAILLGCFVYLWSYSLYGKWSAILAAVLFSFSPNILAHARLITPDITVTTFFFITLYYFWRLLRNARLADAIVGGIFLGLALLAKYTSILLLPIGFVLMILWKTKAQSLHIPRILLFLAVGLGILFLGYGMHPGPYFDGILYQQEQAHISYMRFLMGHYSASGWWYYYTVVFLVKTPIATIIVLTISAILFAKTFRKGNWLNEAFVLIPAVFIIAFFSMNSHDMGLRYILPIYPFVFVFASRAAFIFLFSKKVLALSVASIVWYIGASCYIHPHYLAYFNELVGGPENGYKCLVDSNVDWGQDLKGLKAYMENHGISRIHLSYFGSDSPDRYGISYDWLPSFVLRDPDPQHHETAVTGWVAISATNLQGAYFYNRDMFAWLKRRKPVAKIGYSIFIYKIDD